MIVYINKKKTDMQGNPDMIAAYFIKEYGERIQTLTRRYQDGQPVISVQIADELPELEKGDRVVYMLNGESREFVITDETDAAFANKVKVIQAWRGGRTIYAKP